MMGPIYFFETSVSIYQSRLHNITVELKPRVSLSKSPNGLSCTRQTKEKFSTEGRLDVKIFCQFKLKKTPDYSSFYIPGLITLPRANCYCVSSSFLYPTDRSGSSLYCPVIRFTSSFYVNKHIAKLFS
jgi:hypothetical protein